MDGGERKVVRLYTGFQLFFSLLVWLPVFYEYQKSSGLSDREIFAIQSAYYCAFCLLEIPTGLFADVLGYRRCLGWGALTLVLANVIAAVWTSFAGFLFHFLLVALARSFVSGASTAYLYEWLSQRGRAATFQVVEGRARSWSLVAKVVVWAGVSPLMMWHRTAPYWLTAGFALISWFCALALPDLAVADGPTPTHPKVAMPQGIGGRLAQAFSVCVSIPQVGVLVAQGLAAFVMGRVVQVNLFGPVLEAARIPLGWHGSVMSAMTLAEALGSAAPRVPARWMSRSTQLWILNLALAACVGALAPAHGGVTVAALILFNLACGVEVPLQRQMLNDALPDPRYRATLLSLESLVDRLVCALLAWTMGGFLSSGRLDVFLLGCAGATALLTLLMGRGPRGGSGCAPSNPAV